ncbi:unnamed protein product [Amaranthus hypochondriacus]
MLAMSSPICPNLGWEYPLELGTYQNFDTFDLDYVFLPNSCDSTQDYHVNQSESPQSTSSRGNTSSINHCDYLNRNELLQGNTGSIDHYDKVNRSESLQGNMSSIDHYDNINRSESLPGNTSSTDQFDDPKLVKKFNHNASERERRKKINSMYASLRALLPTTNQKRKQSIPTIVARVLEYIPQIQNEVKNLTHKKELLLSKIGAFHEEKCEINPIINKETLSNCLISTNKLGNQEMVIQISAFERTSINEALLFLEKNHHFVIDVNSFQSFGGRTFYNIHLWVEGNYTVNLEKLKEFLTFHGES